MTEVKDHVLVKRGLYYRPNGNGYTGLKCEAGLYEASYADGDEWITAIPFADAPEFSPACWEETKLSHLQGQLATTRAELAAMKAREVGYVQAMDAMGEELAASKERERETLAVLQTAHESEAALVRQRNALIHVVRWISANYENGEINHKDFRVRAKNLADDALLGDPA